MAGERIPIVIIPRFTTFAGASTFFSYALEVSEYSELQLTLWRAPLVGSGAVFQLSTQQSLNRSDWQSCPGSQDVDPGTNLESAYAWPLDTQWLRTKLVLSGSGPVVTCWAQGFLIRRER